MSCFGSVSPTRRISPSQPRPPRAASCLPLPRLSSPSSSAAPSSQGRDDDGDEERPPPSGAGTTPRSAASPTTFNLLAREYTFTVQTQSYTEIWSKIHTFSGHAPPREDGDQLGPQEEGEASAAGLSSSDHLIGEVLRPDRGSIDEALRLARPGRLTRLVSDYFDNSEHTSRLCLRLHRCVDRARTLYAPLLDILDVLPTPANTTAGTTAASSPMSSSSPAPSQHHHQHPQVHRRHRLSQEQCDWAFDTFQAFNAHDNPFPAPRSGDEGGAGFEEMRCCFSQLRQQLDRRLRRARARARFLHRATVGSAVCLVGSAVGITVAGVIVAAHALPALAAAAPLLGFLRRPGDPLAAQRRRLLEHIAQLEAAARGTYVLNNDLDTIGRLVARLYDTVESDKALVRLGLSRGRGDRHPIEEVVRQLRRNRQGFFDQLRDLEEHVCLCFAAINRARSLLLQHIHHDHHHPQQGRDQSRAAVAEDEDR